MPSTGQLELFYAFQSFTFVMTSNVLLLTSGEEWDRCEVGGLTTEASISENY